MFDYTAGVSFGATTQNIDDGYYLVRIQQDKIIYDGVSELEIEGEIAIDLKINRDIKYLYDTDLLDGSPAKEEDGVFWNFEIELNAVDEDIAVVIDQVLLSKRCFISPNPDKQVYIEGIAEVVEYKPLNRDMSYMKIMFTATEKKLITFTIED